MHDIEKLIAAYCAQNLPPEPAWIVFLNRRFPKIAKCFDATKSVRWEIEDHLQNSYEAYISKGQSPELAWNSAQEHFGDAALISQEIRRVRAHSHKCFMIRCLAIILLLELPLGDIARIRIPSFFSPSILFFMGACAAVGYLITRKRDNATLRKYALYGAWLGLAWGVVQAVKADEPAKIGIGIAAILMSTFYGLFFAAPMARGVVPATMMLLCHVGVLIPCARFGILPLYRGAPDVSLLKTVAAFSIVSVLVGLTVFDIRRIHRRLAAVAAFSMVFSYMRIFSNLTGDNGSILYLVCAASIAPLIAVLVILPIGKLQDYLQHEANQA
jgi:hypothetical protein